MARTIGNFTAVVNGQLTGRESMCGRSIYRPMDLASVLKRIERRLKVTEQTANAASKAAGKPDAIRNIRRAVESGDGRGVTANTISALAPVLRTTGAWLMEQVGPEDPEAESVEEATIPVWGRAGAGGTINNFHGSGFEIERIKAPEYSTEHTGAIEIVGDSLGELFDHWYAVYDEVRDPPTSDLIGKLCVVELNDGRVYIKKLKKGRGKRFTLLSNFDPPIYDVVVKWAARVKNMVPR